MLLQNILIETAITRSCQLLCTQETQFVYAGNSEFHLPFDRIRLANYSPSDHSNFQPGQHIKLTSWPDQFYWIIQEKSRQLARRTLMEVLESLKAARCLHGTF